MDLDLEDHFMRTLLLISVSAVVAVAGDKPNLSGAWQWNPSKSDFHSARLTGLTWVIDQKESTFHLSETERHPDGKEIKTDFDCTTDGKECSINAKGEPASVSLWFNGPALVEMLSKGHNRETVVKKRMRLSEDGKFMNVELIPMVGSEQPGKLVFEKQ
jgi:hypothetical protein